MTIAALHKLFLQYPQACTDTRNIDGPCIFFALKGENFNGNKFANEALRKGAAYVIVDDPKYAVNDQTILVTDVLETLQKLALFHRENSKAKILALTGSNGKTTTKELIYTVLATKYKTIATSGNFNNHIGVPLTLLRIENDTEIAVVEMGANHQREIAFLCTLAMPDYGYITNFGKAHLEGFGGVKGVIKGKSELYDHLIENKKEVFFNADDPIQREKLDSYIRKYGYSQTDSKFYPIKFHGAYPHVKIEVENTYIQTQLIGSYNFGNCAAAIMIGKYFNVPLSDIKSALESYVQLNNRSQFITKNGVNIVLDAYNANPTSMRAALENFKDLKGGPKIAFLGDMFELGPSANKEHQNIADLAASLGLEEIFLIGQHFGEINSKDKQFEDFQALSQYLKEKPVEKGTLLIKGSRGMALERILDLL